jgi:hypothetical protein
MFGPHVENDKIDTSQPHPARMYDYYLGGRDNYEVDREAAERLIAVVPSIVTGARANRAFLRRAVRTVVAEHGIRQIIDVGTGIPTSPNTHEIAHAIAPETRVVYVDNDPLVGAHADARLSDAGHTAFVLADARRPEEILQHPYVAGLIDFGQPVALLLVALLHFIADEDDPAGIISRLSESLPSGSFLVLTHGTSDRLTAEAVHPLTEIIDAYRASTAALSLRSYADVLGFFDGFDLIEPGLVTAAEWRPDPDGPEPAWMGMYSGVARKR